jgi:hypothetical protein
MDRDECNGWVNYPTWLAALWLDSDRGLSAITEELIEEAQNERDLADALKTMLEENKPELTGLWADLIQNQLDGQIDFDEIAKKLLEE